MASACGTDSCVHETAASGVEGWLFSIVCLGSQWQVLNKAKNHIQELEQTLDNLLKMKGNGPLSATPVSFPGKDWLVFPPKAE